MADPAYLQVRALLAAKITGLGQKALEYRSEDDAAQIDEADGGCLVREGDTEIIRLEGHSGGSAWHRTRYFLSFTARPASPKSGREVAGDLMAAAIRALMLDYNLGGQVQEIVPVAYGGEDEPGAKDFGTTTVDIDVTYCTPHDDWTTLI